MYPPHLTLTLHIAPMIKIDPLFWCYYILLPRTSIYISFWNTFRTTILCCYSFSFIVIVSDLFYTYLINFGIYDILAIFPLSNDKSGSINDVYNILLFWFDKCWLFYDYSGSKDILILIFWFEILVILVLINVAHVLAILILIL